MIVAHRPFYRLALATDDREGFRGRDERTLSFNLSKTLNTAAGITVPLTSGVALPLNLGEGSQVGEKACQIIIIIVIFIKKIFIRKI